MDEGEHYHANAFDADDDVFVLFDADDVAGVAGKVTTCDTDGLVLLEIRFIVYFASCCFVGCEESEKVNGTFRDRLNLVVLRVTVDPEWDG